MNKKLAMLATCAMAAFPLFARNHVVFLHGWNSDGGIWSKMKTLLQNNAGYTSDELHSFSYYNNYFGYTKDTPIQTVADGVAREITEIYYETGAPVDVVAHSMGGLVIHAMVARNLIDKKCIRRFIPIATPHFGQNVDDLGGYQPKQMKYGSLFLWELAESWHLNNNKIPQTLCIAGAYSSTDKGCMWDGLVPVWSAALGDDTPVRYVNRSHSPIVSSDTKAGAGIGAVLGGLLTGGIFGALIGGAIGGAAGNAETKDGIYQCQNGASDDVYVLVSQYLLYGYVYPQSSLKYSTPNSKVASQGGIFFQILDKDGEPAKYKSSDSCLVHTYNHYSKGRIIADYLEHGNGDTESQVKGVELVYGTMPAGTYDLVAHPSQTTPDFTQKGIAVRGGRITVVKLDSMSGSPLYDYDDAAYLKTGGSAEWTQTSYPAWSGWYSLRSGVINHGQSTWVEKTVQGEGRLTFYWRPSSETGCDKCVFSLDGEEKCAISGVTNYWSSAAVYTAGPGEHTLRWTYAKDKSTTNGSDCVWVDAIKFCPAAAVFLNMNCGGAVDDRVLRGYAGDYIALPVPQRAGYSFAGWYAAADGDGAPAAATVRFDGEKTYYAQWRYTDTANILFKFADSFETEPDGSFSLDLLPAVESVYTPRFIVKGLPPGLSYDPVSMAISGKAAKPGVYPVEVFATSLTVGIPQSTTFDIIVPNLSCAALPGLLSAPDAYGTITCGVAFAPGLVDCTPADGWTVKASGLPQGLKFNANTGTISGIPARAGEYMVTFTASKRGEQNQTATITLKVDALPEWAAGTFAGYARAAAESPEGTADETGLFTMTVSGNGRISGKISMSGTNWTFSAASYTEKTTVDGADAYFADVQLKAGRQTARLGIYTAASAGTSGGGLIDAAVAGEACRGETLDSDPFMRIEARRNAWKDKSTASAAKELAAKWAGVYAIAVDSGYLSATVGKDGSVKAAGKLPDGTGVSASSFLSGDGAEGMTAFLYAAPAAYKGGAFAADLKFDSPRGTVEGDKAASCWISRSPTATEVYGEGFRRNPVVSGAYYGTPSTLGEYYEGLKVSMGTPPAMEYATRETYIGGNGRRASLTSQWLATGTTSRWQSYSLALNAAGTAFAMPAATRPVNDRTDGMWIYDGANDGALTFTANKATGVFKGSFTYWFDYVSAYDWTTGRETQAHVSKRVNFEGIAVPGRDCRGFYLWDAAARYTETATGREKTYRFKESHPVLLTR